MAALLFLMSITATLVASGQEVIGPSNRDETRAIIADLRKVVTPTGLERLQKIRIGDIDQYVSVRSRDIRNPVLLVLHGGPGWVSMPTAWFTAHGWDEYFTVIQWDQRGAGKTYLASDPVAVAPTMTVERMHADAVEIVQWARQEFRKQKILVLGHSWGSVLGLTLAQRHPEWLHAYIGVAQAVDARESERRGWRWTFDRAQAAKNAAAMRDLESIAPYGQGTTPIPLDNILLQRKWLNFFGGAAYQRPDASFEAAAANLSPEYSDEDVKNLGKSQAYSAGHLLSAVLETNFSQVREFKIPLVLFLGRHDINLSSAVAAEWYTTVRAPQKQLIWFEQSGHELLAEEPGRALLSLVNVVRPIAAHSGDAAP
jgi:pimeloyl-ACP methyl ester carboxylesterase